MLKNCAHFVITLGENTTCLCLWGVYSPCTTKVSWAIIPSVVCGSVRRKKKGGRRKEEKKKKPTCRTKALESSYKKKLTICK